MTAMIVKREDGEYHYDKNGALIKIVVSMSSTLKGVGGVK